MDESTPELFYEKFIGDVNQSLTQIAEYVEEEWCLQDLPDIALRMAISCYCSKLVCERLIDIIRSSASAEENKKKEKPDIKLVEQHENKQEYKKETKERFGMKRHVIVIGGGAAGMAAAISSRRQGAGVTILERNPRVGKLLATGNGQVQFHQYQYLCRIL